MTTMTRKIKLTLTTNAGGTATATTDRPLNGEICGIYMSIGTLAATSDITITQDDGQGSLPVLTITNLAASDWYAPGINQHDYATGTATAYTHVEMPVAGYVTVAVAQGGASKVGTAYILVSE
jgi:hypothetical protein